MDKIKLLFVAEELAVNGAMMSMLALLRALPREKFHISLFLFDHGGEMMDQLPLDVHLLSEKLAYSVHRLPSRQAFVKAVRRGRLDLIFYRILVSIQRRRQIDYNFWWWLPEVEGNYDVVCCYTDGFVAPMIQRKVTSGKKCCWIHFPYTHAPLMHYEYEALKTADACVVVSKTVGIDLNKALGCKSAPQYIVHNIVDSETCIQRAQEAIECPRLLGINRIVSVGRVTPAKGFDIICPIAKLLKEKGIIFEWYILGDGEDLLKFRQMAVEMAVEDCVHFIGSKLNPMPWIKSADVVVQPSIFESWGMTVSEALCLGKVVITSDLPVFSEQITDGVNGLMRPNKPAYMAEAIKVILFDETLRLKIEEQAIKYPFTKSVIVGEFEEMIDRLKL